MWADAVSHDGSVCFRGTYNPMTVTTQDKNMLYLDSGSTLRHPDSGTPINAFRAYFQLRDIPSDVNGDGEVNINDVTALINYLLSGDASSIIINKADVNGDGVINIGDVTALIYIILRDDSIINVVVNGAEGLTFGGIGPAR